MFVAIYSIVKRVKQLFPHRQVNSPNIDNEDKPIIECYTNWLAYCMLCILG